MTRTEAIKRARSYAICFRYCGQWAVQTTPLGGGIPYETSGLTYWRAQKAASAHKAGIAVEMLGGDRDAQLRASDLVYEGTEWTKAI